MANKLEKLCLPPDLKGSGWRVFDARPVFDCLYKRYERAVKIKGNKYKMEPYVLMAVPAPHDSILEVRYTLEDWKRHKARWKRLQKKILESNKRREK